MFAAEQAPITNAPPPVPPRIPKRARHYSFALLVLAGYSYDDACQHLGINTRTAERWRTDLRRRAHCYFGRAVTYEFAARVALDDQFRRVCESVRGSPHPSAKTPCPASSEMRY